MLVGARKAVPSPQIPKVSPYAQNFLVSLLSTITSLSLSHRCLQNRPWSPILGPWLFPFEFFLVVKLLSPQPARRLNGYRSL